MCEGTTTQPVAEGQPGTTGPQQVYVAGFWRRLTAAVLDLLFVAPVLALLAWIAMTVTGFSLPQLSSFRLESLLEIALGGEGVFQSSLVMVLLLLVVYSALFLGITGATPGLRLVRLRVINIYGQVPEFWRVLLRCLGFVVSCLLLGLGFIWIGFDREKRGLPDWMAGTYVIRPRS